MSRNNWLILPQNQPDRELIKLEDIYYMIVGITSYSIISHKII